MVILHLHLHLHLCIGGFSLALKVDPTDGLLSSYSTGGIVFPLLSPWFGLGV